MDKVFRIGIDRLSLYNFKIIKMCEGIVINSSNDTFTQESTHIKDELFSLDTSMRMYKDSNEVREFRTLTFNPNKLLTGTNINNSRETELVESLNILEKILKDRGIVIDFTEAKINTIEINLNLKIDFRTFEEVFKLLFTNLKKSKATSRVTENTRLINKLEAESFFYKNNSLKIRVYDKTAEINNLEILSTPVTRVEYAFERATYHRFLKNLGQQNTLEALINNIQLIDFMFITYVKKDFIKKSLNYIQNNIKIELERQYIAFRKSNKMARESGKPIQRNVYRYLETFWIFDYAFVIEIIKAHEKKNAKREIQRVKKILSKHINLRKFNFLVENFLSSQLSFSEEDQKMLERLQELKELGD